MTTATRFNAIVEIDTRGQKRIVSLSKNVDTLNSKLRKIGSAAKVAAAGFIAFQAGRLAFASVNTGIARIESERRIKALGRAYGESAQLQDIATASAKKFGLSQTEANQGLALAFARLRPVGVELKEITSVYNGFNTAAKLSGASAIEAKNAFIQLAQGLGSGALRGDEFNSIAEQVPIILTAVSKATGVAQGDLRDYAAEGKITADVVIKALRQIETDGADQLTEALGGPQQAIKDFQNASEDVQVALTETIIPEMANSFKELALIIKGLEPLIRGIGGLIGDTLVEARLMIDAIKGGGNAVNTVRTSGQLPFSQFIPTSETVNGKKRLTTVAEKEFGQFFGQERFQELKSQARDIAKATNKSFSKALAERLTAAINVIDRTKEIQAKSKIKEKFVSAKDAGIKVGDTVGEDTSKARAISDISQQQLERILQINVAKSQGRVVDAERLELESRVLEIQEKGINNLKDQAALNTAQTALTVFDNEQALINQKELVEQKQRETDMFFQLDGLAQQRISTLAREAEAIERLKNPINGVRDALDEMAGGFDFAYQGLQQFTQVGVQGLSDGLTDLLINGSTNFNEFAANLLRDLARVLIQSIAVKAILQAIGFGGGGGSAFDFSNLPGFAFVGSAGGNVVNKQGAVPLKKFARGGITSGPVLSLAGEAGPEAIVPLPDGRSIPVNMRGGGQRTVNIGDVNIKVENTGEDLNADAQKALAAQVQGLVIDQIVNERRSGGLLT